MLSNCAGDGSRRGVSKWNRKTINNIIIKRSIEIECPKEVGVTE